MKETGEGVLENEKGPRSKSRNRNLSRRNTKQCSHEAVEHEAVFA